MLTFIQKVFHNNKKEYILLFIFMIIISSFEFCCLALYDASDSFSLDFLTSLSAHALSTFSTFVILVLNIMIVKYFIENKKQEFAILLLSGRKPKDLFYYMMMQFGPMTLGAFIIGIIGGLLLIMLINTCLHYLSIPVQLIYHPGQILLFYFLFLIITVVLILAICAHQFVELDKQLVLYLSHKKSSRQPPYKIYFSAISSKRRFPFLSILFTLLIIYITVYCVIEIIYAKSSFMFIFRYYMFALLGAIILILSTIPLIYDSFHHYLVKHPILLHALANFNDFSSVMMTMVQLNAVLIPTFLFLIILSGQNLLLQILVIPCFIMMIIIICLCFLLKYTFYDKAIRQPIATYDALGYNPPTLKKIMGIKNFIFILFAIMIPLWLFIELAYKAYLESYLPLQICFVLVGIYIISYCFIMIYIFIKEKKMLQEATSHVKYFN